MIKPFVVFYYSAAVAAVVLMNGYNVGIDGSSLRHIFEFDFYFVTAGCFLFTAILHGYTRHRLAPVPEMTGDAAFERLTRFPSEVFALTIGSGVLFSASYHAIEVYVLRIRPFDELVVRHIVVEQAFGWTLAFVYMSAVRLLLRPRLKRLQAVSAAPSRTRSFVRLWLPAFMAGLAMTSVPQIWFIRNETMRGELPHPAETAAVSFAALAVASAVMLSFFLPLRQELQAMSAAIRELLRAGSRGPAPLPIGTKDEIGELTAAMNALQAKAAKEEEELRGDLALAGAVQRMLLPDDRQTFDGLGVYIAHRSAKEVGGDFCDCIRLGNGRAALVIGEVSGEGVSAALMMTATVMLLRTEMKAGGGAGNVLTRLNESIFGTARGETMVTLGLALVDPASGTIEYAGAGQTAPVLLRGGAVHPRPADALPLGALPDTSYESVVWETAPGDRVLLFTSGFVERLRPAGEEDGFLALRRLLEESAPGLGAEELHARLAAGAEAAATGPDRRTDRTLLLAELTGEPAKEAKRYG